MHQISKQSDTPSRPEAIRRLIEAQLLGIESPSAEIARLDELTVSFAAASKSTKQKVPE